MDMLRTRRKAFLAAFAHYLLLHVCASSNGFPTCHHCLNLLLLYSAAQANIIRAVKMQHPSLSDEEVLVLLEHECPREYCVMKQDLQNISVKIQRATFRQAEDDACSVRRLVQEKYPDKVCKR